MNIRNLLSDEERFRILEAIADEYVAKRLYEKIWLQEKLERLTQTAAKKSKVERVYPYFLRSLLLLRKAVARAKRLQKKLSITTRTLLEKTIYYANVIADIKRGELWRAKYEILDPNVQPKDIVNRYINHFRDLLDTELFNDKERQLGRDIIKYMISF